MPYLYYKPIIVQNLRTYTSKIIHSSAQEWVLWDWYIRFFDYIEGEFGLYTAEDSTNFLNDEEGSYFDVIVDLSHEK
jgi:hypothetical protein